MIRLLTPADRQLILDYAYAAEKENMFVIGSLSRAGDPFEDNVYLGNFDDDQLVGLGVHFTRFGSLVIHARNDECNVQLTDAFVERKAAIEFVPAFRRHGMPTIERLRKFGHQPTEVAEQTVFLLTPETFHDHADDKAELATTRDIDEIIRLQWAADEEDPQQEITQKDRLQILPDAEWITREQGRIVARANVQGVSDHYIQIGGVATHPAYQKRGYAKRTVSAVCRFWMQQGKHVLLFCRNENIPALRVYEALGFRPIDAFVIGVYDV